MLPYHTSKPVAKHCIGGLLSDLAFEKFARILSMETENDDSLKCWEDFSDLGVNIEQPKHISSNVCDELQFQVCHKKHLYFP